MNNKEIDNFESREEELFQRFLEKNYTRETTDTLKDEPKPQNNEIPEEIVIDPFDQEEEITTIKMLIPEFDEKAEKSAMENILSYIFSRENSPKIVSLCFIAFLMIFLALNILTPSKKVSEKENRTLALFPKISISSLTS